MAIDPQPMNESASTTRTTSTSASRGAVLAWLIPLMLVAGFGGWIYTTSLEPRSATPVPAAPSVTLDIPDVHPHGKLIMLVNHALESLGGVSDADAARAAVPQLNAVTEGLDTVDGNAMHPADASMSDGILEKLPELIAPLMEEIKAMPGATAILKPAVKSLLAKAAATARRIQRSEHRGETQMLVPQAPQWPPRGSS